MQTRCMAACVGHIRLQGLVQLNKDGTWKEDRQNPLYYLIHVAKVALPLYPQFGTEPNGYYIPPRWVPRPYLQQMFGPGVDAAIERYSAPDRELLAVLQLFRELRETVGPGALRHDRRGGTRRVWRRGWTTWRVPTWSCAAPTRSCSHRSSRATTLVRERVRVGRRLRADRSDGRRRRVLPGPRPPSRRP